MGSAITAEDLKRAGSQMPEHLFFSTLEALLQTRRDLWVLHVGAQRAIAQPDLGVAYNETCLLMESGGSERVEERPTHGEALP